MVVETIQSGVSMQNLNPAFHSSQKRDVIQSVNSTLGTNKLQIRADITYVYLRSCSIPRTEP